MGVLGVGSIPVALSTCGSRDHEVKFCHHTDCGPMGLGQYNSLGEYCGPHTASSVFFLVIY